MTFWIMFSNIAVYWSKYIDASLYTIKGISHFSAKSHNCKCYLLMGWRRNTPGLNEGQGRNDFMWWWNIIIIHKRWKIHESWNPVYRKAYFSCTSCLLSSIYCTHSHNQNSKNFIQIVIVPKMGQTFSRFLPSTYMPGGKSFHNNNHNPETTISSIVKYCVM